MLHAAWMTAQTHSDGFVPVDDVGGETEVVHLEDVSVASVRADKHPAAVDGQVDAGQLLLAELDHLDNLHVPGLDIEQEQCVISTHRQQLAPVDNPHQTFNLTETMMYTS